MGSLDAGGRRQYEGRRYSYTLESHALAHQLDGRCWDVAACESGMDGVSR